MKMLKKQVEKQNKLLKGELRIYKLFVNNKLKEEQREANKNKRNKPVSFLINFAKMWTIYLLGFSLCLTYITKSLFPFIMMIIVSFLVVWNIRSVNKLIE
jgi:hypothetical protein